MHPHTLQLLVAVLPPLALVVFFGVGLLVSVYVATDGRGAHRRRMEELALEEAPTSPLPRPQEPAP